MKRGFDWKAHLKKDVENDHKKPISELIRPMVTELSFCLQSDKPWGEKHILVSSNKLKVLHKWSALIYWAIGTYSSPLRDFVDTTRDSIHCYKGPENLTYLDFQWQYFKHCSIIKCADNLWQLFINITDNAPALDKEHTIVLRDQLKMGFNWALEIQRKLTEMGIDLVPNPDDKPWQHNYTIKEA